MSEMYISQSCTATAPSNRYAVFRSPSQMKNPDSAKRKANAARLP